MLHQMRPALLISLILLILLVEAEGIRLEQGFKSAVHKRIQKVEYSRSTDEVEANGSAGGVADVVLCRDGQCSGRNRKLMGKSSSSSTTTTKTGTNVDPAPASSNEGFDKNKEQLSVKSPPVSKHGEVTTQHYPDIIDIAGMDYSPAKRKPPIHN